MEHNSEWSIGGFVPGARAAAVLAVTCMFSACGGSSGKAEVHTVAVVAASRTSLSNSMTFQGEFYPFQDVMIHAKISGYVNPIRVDIGDRVKAGELLATLEVPELKDEFEGALASARRAEAEHVIAHLNYTRLVEVNKSQPNLVAQQDLDDAEAKDSAMKAAFAAAKAEAEKFKTLSDYTRVLAPFDGVVTKRYVDDGTLVEAGTSSGTVPVVELAQNRLLRLRFPVPEAETPLIRDGGEVSVSIDAVHRIFTGRISRDSWEIDRSTRTMIVEVDVPNPDDVFKAGMYASVKLTVQAADGVIAVPLQALSSDSSPSILVVTKDGNIGERKVSVGMRTASLAEIQSGLSEGDLVVVGDRSALTPGMSVSPKIIDALASE